MVLCAIVWTDVSQTPGVENAYLGHYNAMALQELPEGSGAHKLRADYTKTSVVAVRI